MSRSRRRHIVRLLIFGLLATACGAVPAAAHPSPFSYLELRLDEDRARGTLVLHDFDVAHDIGVAPPEALLDETVADRHREAIAALVDRRLRLQADGTPLQVVWGPVTALPDRQSLGITFEAPFSASPATLRVDALLFPYDPVHQTFVTVYEGRALREQAVMDRGRRTLVYYRGTAQGTGAVIRTFVASGIEHILIGPDHILFIVGLLLPGGSLLTLASIVTAFTVGHSLTLSAAVLDWIAPPARLVEPLIALSIVFVGVDALAGMRRRDRDTRRRDLRTPLAGAFGLVHGFGFASVLREFGLPSSALGLSLVSFNVGVEVGQLAIVAVVAAALAILRHRDPATAGYVARAGALGIIAMGIYWFGERALGAF